MIAGIPLQGVRQRALMDVLLNSGDVSVRTLFRAIEGPDRYDISNHSRMRWLGTYLYKLNRRLAKHGLAVKPGDAKQTYRLFVI